MVGTILFVISMFPDQVIQLFDKKGSFVELAAVALPIISMFVLFDVVQIILSGALRGASFVKTVMWTRLLVCMGIFAPLSYAISLIPVETPVLKFIGIYSSFYVSNGIMSLIYMIQLKRYSASHRKTSLLMKGTHESHYQPRINKTSTDFPDHRP
jgi:Na+-driven multidrug efflux pump